MWYVPSCKLNSPAIWDVLGNGQGCVMKPPFFVEHNLVVVLSRQR